MVYAKWVRSWYRCFLFRRHRNGLSLWRPEGVCVAFWDNLQKSVRVPCWLLRHSIYFNWRSLFAHMPQLFLLGWTEKWCWIWVVAGDAIGVPKKWMRRWDDLRKWPFIFRCWMTLYIAGIAMMVWLWAASSTVNVLGDKVFGTVWREYSQSLCKFSTTEWQGFTPISGTRQSYFREYWLIPDQFNTRGLRWIMTEETHTFVLYRFRRGWRGNSQQPGPEVATIKGRSMVGAAIKRNVFENDKFYANKFITNGFIWASIGRLSTLKDLFPQSIPIVYITTQPILEVESCLCNPIATLGIISMYVMIITQIWLFQDRQSLPQNVKLEMVLFHHILFWDYQSLVLMVIACKTLLEDGRFHCLASRFPIRRPFLIERLVSKKATQPTT